MIPSVNAGDNDRYRALLELAHSLSGYTDIQQFCDALAHALKPVIAPDYLRLMLSPDAQEILRLRGTTGASADMDHDVASAAVNDNPAAWVWQSQTPMAIPDLRQETRWFEFTSKFPEPEIRSLALLPLTDREHRLGVLVLGKHDAYVPNEAEMAFLQHVAWESAVALDAFLMERKFIQERDRLQVLFDITNTLTSKLAPEELFSSIFNELNKVIEYDVAGLRLLDDESGKLKRYTLHFQGDARLDVPSEPIPREGHPAGEALKTGRPVLTSGDDFKQFPSPLLRRLRESGIRSLCSIPLITPNGALGALLIARQDAQGFPRDEVDLCLQVARQVAIAIENSLTFRQVAEMRDKLITEKLYLENEIRVDQNLTNMIGESPAFQALLKSARVVAATDAAVLISGETGTGKELVAWAIHEMSSRSNHTFVKVDCAAIPATLLESELFGHEKGAFTGANTSQVRRFELADHGTLFLDEVGEIPVELQSKLLRAIQEQEFERLGSNRTIHVDIRVIAATNRDLKAMVEDGRFRSDLYYRLHVFPIGVPPLRERKTDIPLLIRYFTQKYSQRTIRNIESIPSSAVDALVAYDWPGNIRELQNLVERSVILTEGPVLRLVMPESSVSPPGGAVALPWLHERERILHALKESKGVVGGPHGAAKRLGMKRTTLQSRMKKLTIGREYR